MSNSKHARHMCAIAKAINDLECAHIELRYVKTQGSAEWHRTTARLYDATAELVDLGVPMTLAGMYGSEGAQCLRNDAAENRRVAMHLERNAA